MLSVANINIQVLPFFAPHPPSGLRVCVCVCLWVTHSSSLGEAAYGKKATPFSLSDVQVESCAVSPKQKYACCQLNPVKGQRKFNLSPRSTSKCLYEPRHVAEKQDFTCHVRKSSMQTQLCIKSVWGIRPQFLRLADKMANYSCLYSTQHEWADCCHLVTVLLL